MNSYSDPKRVVGALRFLAELSDAASECAGVWDDELTARRRQRVDARSLGENFTEELQVKAL